MKRLIIFGILIFFLSESISAQTWKQRRLEAYGGISTLNYFGDIGGSADKSNLFGLKDISIRSTRPGISLGVSYRLTKLFYVRTHYTLGYITQSDKGSINNNRNYAFTTMLNEISFQGVFFIKPESDKNYYYSVMQLRGGLNQLNKPLSFYVYGGVGGSFFSVTPKENLVGSNRFTNNQSFTLAIPIGIGLKFAYSPTISFGAELGVRYLFSDYIDGFTSVNSKHNDLYYLMNLKVIYRFPKSKRLRGFSR